MAQMTVEMLMHICSMSMAQMVVEMLICICNMLYGTNDSRDAYAHLYYALWHKWMWMSSQWYDQGGVLLVKNMETAFKEVEGQEAQAMAQLDMQIPKNHPMRAQAEAQV